jgi:hypothetical protein
MGKHATTSKVQNSIHKCKQRMYLACTSSQRREPLSAIDFPFKFKIDARVSFRNLILLNFIVIKIDIYKKNNNLNSERIYFVRKFLFFYSCIFFVEENIFFTY